MLGLKRGTVQLCEHEQAWEIEAQNTILRLKEILGAVIKDIQHVGSTSIPSIKAKPIIDIAIAIDDFEDVLLLEEELKKQGFYYRPKVDLGEQLLFASGSYYDGTGDLQTHFIINMTDRPWRNSDMARPRKNNITIDEEIIKQEEQVSKSKAKYDADVKKLKDLYAKKDEMKKKELLAAVGKSSKTYEEILRFLQGEA